MDKSPFTILEEMRDELSEGDERKEAIQYALSYILELQNIREKAFDYIDVLESSDPQLSKIRKDKPLRR